MTGKWLRPLLLALVLLAPAAAQGVSTTVTALRSDQYTDLGAGPMLLGVNNPVAFAISDIEPLTEAGSAYYLYSGPPRDLQTTSHVWALARTLKDTSATTTPLIPAGAAFVPVVWTSTVVTLGAGSNVTIAALDGTRKALRWMNVGANPMTVAPGVVTVTVGQGMNYNPPGPDTASQGGSESFGPNEGSTQAFSAKSTSGTTVIVWEGR